MMETMTSGITSIRIKSMKPLPISEYHSVVSFTNGIFIGSAAKPDTACMASPSARPSTVAISTLLEKLNFFFGSLYTAKASSR